MQDRFKLLINNLHTLVLF